MTVIILTDVKTTSVVFEQKVLLWTPHLNLFASSPTIKRKDLSRITQTEFDAMCGKGYEGKFIPIQ